MSDHSHHRPITRGIQQQCDQMRAARAKPTEICMNYATWGRFLKELDPALAVRVAKDRRFEGVAIRVSV